MTSERHDPLPADVEPDYDRLPALVDEAILAQRHDIRKHLIERSSPLDYKVLPFDEHGYLYVMVAGVPLRRVHWSELADTPRGAA